MSEAPDYYRGIKVPEIRKRYWDKPTMRAWREAVDSTLNTVLAAVKSGLEEHQDRQSLYSLSEWHDGVMYARGELREEMIDSLHEILTDTINGTTSLGNL